MMNDGTAILAFAILLSALCVVLGRLHAARALAAQVEILVVTGLGLGAVLTPAPIHAYFLIGILGYAGFSIFKGHRASATKMISLGQIVLAILLTFITAFTENSWAIFAGLLLTATFLPLFPFHVPFCSLLNSAQGALAGLWTTVWLSLGLAQLANLHPALSEELRVGISGLALAGALYASLKCLGQRHIRPFLTYATVAHIALLWGLTTVFTAFASWGVPFGVTIALIMTGLIVSYDCIQQRFGLHPIGSLPGLASSMPRFGVLLMILITIAVALPIFPILAGLPAMPTTDNQDVSLVVIGFILLSVWMLGSWYFSHLLHRTAFGQARPDIPYRDLNAREIWALALLIVAASYHGLFY